MIRPFVGESEKALPPLERACFFASWCGVGKFHGVAKWWIDYALVLAVRPRGHGHSTRGRC